MSNNDASRAFTWGCFLTLGVVFALTVLPLLSWLFCCGGFGLLGIGGVAVADKAIASRRESQPVEFPTRRSVSRPAEQPNSPTDPVEAMRSYLGRVLSRDESAEMLSLFSSDRKETLRPHAGATIGMTGVVEMIEDGIVAMSFGRRQGSRTELLAAAACPPASIAKIRPGDTVCVVGKVDSVRVDPKSASIILLECRVTSHTQTEANAATDAAERERQRLAAIEVEKMEQEAARRRAEESARRDAETMKRKAEAAEQDAATLLRFAKAATIPASRAKQLREIIEKYPNTKAAEEARKLLSSP